jgi:thioesterase domain-containing protein
MELVETVGHYWRTKIEVSYDDLCRLQPEEQLAYLLDWLKEAQVVPDDTDISQVRRLLQVSEYHQSCQRRYRPKPYAGRITLLRSEATEHDPWSWTPFSSEPVEVHTVSGDHVLMLMEPYVTSLAAQLQQCLDRCELQN